jgi:hypothetical protein
MRNLAVEAGQVLLAGIGYEPGGRRWANGLGLAAA